MIWLVFLAAGMFAMGCDDYVMAGLLPGAAASLGTSVAAAAQGIAAFGSMYVAAAPVCAILLARQPVRRVLVAALGVFLAGNLLTLASGHLAGFLVGRAVAGLGAGLYLPIAVGAAAQGVDERARGRVLSLVWGANSAGAVIGVPVGLWLAGQAGWRAALALVVVLGAVTLLGIAWRQPQVRVEAPPSLGDQVRLLGDRRVLAIIGVTALTATASLGLYDFVAPLMAGTGNAPAAALSLWNLGGLVGSTAIGFWVDRTGKPARLMVTILASLMMTFLLLASWRTVPVVGLVPFLVWGALGWATVTPQQTSLIDRAPGHEATLIALNSSAVSLGSVLGAVLGGGALAGGLDVRTLPYAAAGLLLGAWAWQAWLVQRPRVRQASA